MNPDMPERPERPETRKITKCCNVCYGLPHRRPKKGRCACGEEYEEDIISVRFEKDPKSGELKFKV
jgi:hypothetical protein